MKRVLFILIKLGLLPKKGVHYIGGTEVLPPPLKGEQERLALEQSLIHI